VIQIATDSSAHLPVEERQKYNIAVIPLKAIFGTTVYRDEVDLTNEQFYRMLPDVKEHPTTSQPSAGEFEQFYKPFIEAGKEIVSLHLPSKLSGTYASACAAKQNLEQQFKRTLPISIVDTPWLSMALGLLVIAAAQAAQAGKSREQILATVEALIPKLNLIFVVDTLEYLRRGGRIGGARALVGTLLQVKPMLEIRNGQVEPLEQPRSRARALARLLEVLKERADQRPLHVAVLHANAPQEAEKIAEQVRAQYECKEFYITEIGPVIGIHSGPGAVGLAFYTD